MLLSVVTRASCRTAHIVGPPPPVRNFTKYLPLQNVDATVNNSHIPTKAKKYVVRKYFQGIPKKSDFEVVEYELPALNTGDILVKTEWISVDPYQRAYNVFNKVPYDQFSYQVGLVEDSKHPSFPVGSRVISHKGWCNYSIINKNKDSSDQLYKLPDLRGLSNSLALGAVGMPGATAYFGLLEICKPKSGETVVVSGAAGAVGTLVGQIAKIKGCKVIGFAGSDEKVEWLENHLGFDKAINYKSANVRKVLKEAAPKGVDCYFDNVGGELSSNILNQMNEFGRVAVCGSISSYNDVKLPQATITQPAIVTKQLKVEGFIVSRWAQQWPEAYTELTDWVISGQLKTREHITVGFENIYEAFIGMLAGENFGKALVKV